MEELLTRGKTTLSNEFIVGSVPTVFYVPNYITTAEEEQLLNNIYQAPVSKWKSLMNRRLQNWGGVVHEKGLLAQDLPPWLKKVTSRIYEEELKLFPSAINHVLVNEYLPDQGIMPHQDGAAYVPVVAIISLGSPAVMNFAPHSRFALEFNIEGRTTIYSNAASMDMESSEQFAPFSVGLMPRSLLIFKDEAYSDYLHGIKDCVDHRYDEVVNITSVENCDDGDGGDAVGLIHRTSARVSLTCRVVTKVHKHFIKL